MSYQLPIDKTRFDYRSNELFYNSLMQSCEDSCLYNYERIFRHMENADELSAVCKKQFEAFTRERIAILMTMPHPDHHAVMTARKIALRQSYHQQFKNEREYLNGIKSHEIENFSEIILDDILYEQNLTKEERLSVQNRLSARDCYLYYLRYQFCLEPEQIAKITVWRKEAIPSQLEFLNKRFAKAILPLFQVDMRYKANQTGTVEKQKRKDRTNK